MLSFFGKRDDKKKLSPAEKDDITIHTAGKSTRIIVIQMTIRLTHKLRLSEGFSLSLYLCSISVNLLKRAG